MVGYAHGGSWGENPRFLYENSHFRPKTGVFPPYRLVVSLPGVGPYIRVVDFDVPEKFFQVLPVENFPI